MFLRMLNSFAIEKVNYIESHPINGVENPGSLTTQPIEYKVRFVPRNLKVLEKALEGVRM